MSLKTRNEQPKPGYLVRIALFALAVWVCSFGLKAQADPADEDANHSGYLSDVSEERGDPSHEVVIMPMAEPGSNGKLIDKIFTEKLKRDFVKQYRETFGYTEYEQINNTSSRYLDIESADSNRLTSTDDYISKQKTFGNYMMKKMIEYHVDNYLKNNHDLKVVYETKEKFSNLEYKTDNGSKVKFKYDFSSNLATISLEKPEEKFHKSVDFKPSLNSPNTILRASYDITKVLRIESNYGIDQELGTLILGRKLAPNLGVSITAQTFQKDLPDGTPAQSRMLLGMTWND